MTDLTQGTLANHWAYNSAGLLTTLRWGNSNSPSTSQTAFHALTATTDQNNHTSNFTYRSYAATKREEDTGIPLMMAA